MGKEEGKYPDEKQGHKHKGIVNQGIFVPVVFLRMRIEFGKACGGGRMTFLARCKNILFGQLGTGSLYLLDCVVSVAVGALCHGGIA